MQKLLKLFDSLSKYLVVAILVIIPLYPKFPFIRIPGVYVSIRLEDFLLATVGVLALAKLITNFKSAINNKVFRSVCTFLIIAAVSLFSAIFVTQTVQPAIGILHFIRRIEYFIPLFFAITYLSVGKKENIEFYIKTLVITIFAVFIYGIGQRFFNFPVIITQNSEYSKGIALTWSQGSHIASTFAGHYDLASFLVLVMPILVSLVFIVKDRVSKIYLILASFGGFWLLINSLSRVSFLSYLIAISISLFLLKKYKAIFIVVLLSFILSAFSPSLFARYKRIYDVVQIKVLSIIEVKAKETVLPDTVKEVKTPPPAPVFEDRSTSIRFNVEWPRAVRALRKNPLLGTGYSSISLATDNDYLRLLGEVGILGFLAFLLILINIALIFMKSLPIYKYDGIFQGFFAGIVGGSVGTLVNAMFIDVFEASKFAIIFWLLIGVTINSLTISKNE